MSFNKNAQEHKLVRAIKLSDAEMEKVSGGGYRYGGVKYGYYKKEVGYFYGRRGISSAKAEEKL
ncbi:MAG: hypothetical protein AB4206_05055 [Xenococcaceae cyanobacterium]